MNENNRKIVVRLLEGMRRFDSGDIDLDEVRSRVESSIGLFERDGTNAGQDVRSAAADLEEIQFLVALGNQRAAATSRLNTLRDALTAQLGDS